MRIAFLGWILILSPAVSGQAGVTFSSKLEYCCVDGFTPDHAVALARRLARSDQAALKRYRFSDRFDDLRMRGSGTDRAVDLLVKDYLTEAAIHRQLALYLSTPSGEAIDIWNGSERSFELQPFSPFPGVDNEFRPVSPIVGALHIHGGEGHIDIFNPNSGLLGYFLHGWDVVVGNIGGILQKVFIGHQTPFLDLPC